VTSRLVFGQSLSPDEIRRVHVIVAQFGCCARFDRPLRWGASTSRREAPTQEECRACRLREECGVRKDNVLAADNALERARATLRFQCGVVGERCIDFPACGHPREAVRRGEV
jgi:hypothetical protein